MINWSRQIRKQSSKLFRAPKSSPKGRAVFRYEVHMPNAHPVVVRAHNKPEAKATVREANNLTRLPTGTITTRL